MNEVSNTLKQRLSVLLHDLDPINSYCNALLDMEDYYECSAAEIVRLLEKGMPLRQAVSQVFDSFFWEGCLLEARRVVNLDTLTSALEAEMQRTPDAIASDGVPELHRTLFDRFMLPIPLAGRWTYSSFVQQLPAQLAEDWNCMGYFDLRAEPQPKTDDDTLPVSGVDEDDDIAVTFLSERSVPFAPEDMPFLHQLFFEKIMRRLPVDQQTSYESFREQLLHHTSN